MSRMMVEGLGLACIIAAAPCQSPTPSSWRDFLPETFAEPQVDFNKVLAAQKCWLFVNPSLYEEKGVEGMFPAAARLADAERNVLGALRDGEPLCTRLLRVRCEDLLELAFRDVAPARELKDIGKSGNHPWFVFAVDARGRVQEKEGTRTLYLDVSLRLARVTINADLIATSVDVLHCDRSQGSADLPPLPGKDPGPLREYVTNVERSFYMAVTRAISSSLGPSLFGYPRLFEPEREWIKEHQKLDPGKPLRELYVAGRAKP